MFTKILLQRSATQRILDRRSPVTSQKLTYCGASSFAVEVPTSRSKEVYVIGALQLRDASLGGRVIICADAGKTCKRKQGMTLRLGERHVGINGTECIAEQS